MLYLLYEVLDMMRLCSICKEETPENLQAAKWEAKDSQDGEYILCPHCLRDWFLPTLVEVSQEVFESQL